MLHVTPKVVNIIAAVLTATTAASVEVTHGGC